MRHCLRNASPTKGRVREALILEQFLKPYLPERFTVSSGLIMDVEQNESRQQDLLIHDSFHSPVLLNVESERIIFPESVFAVIEVKSNLRSKDIKDIIIKAADISSLTKSKAMPIFISTNVGLPGGHPPILSSALCFESDLSLEDIIPRLRDIRGEIEKGYWLSLILILKDKEDQSGLIVNANKEAIQEIQLIPNKESRLMLVRAENSGDALLYFYLLLMEHLRRCGLITPGPNLIQYAESSGLGKMEHSMSRDEFLGASFDFKGQKVDLSAADRLKELVIRAFGDEITITDEEIIEMIVLQLQMPEGYHHLNPLAFFRLSSPDNPQGEVLTYASPRTVALAAKKKIAGKATDSDEKVLKWYIEIFRRLKPEKLALSVCS